MKKYSKRKRYSRLEKNRRAKNIAEKIKKHGLNQKGEQ